MNFIIFKNINEKYHFVKKYLNKFDSSTENVSCKPLDEKTWQEKKKNNVKGMAY